MSVFFKLTIFTVVNIILPLYFKDAHCASPNVLDLTVRHSFLSVQIGSRVRVPLISVLVDHSVSSFKL